MFHVHFIFFTWKGNSLTVSITFMGTKEFLDGLVAKLPKQNKTSSSISTTSMSSVAFSGSHNMLPMPWITSNKYHQIYYITKHFVVYNFGKIFNNTVAHRWTVQLSFWPMNSFQQLFLTVFLLTALISRYFPALKFCIALLHMLHL